jgi:hypothetical protein
MTDRDSWDELLDEARAALREQDENDPNAELGDAMTPNPEDHLQGRWRGEGEMLTRGGRRRVFFVWRRGDNKPGFLYAHAQLVAQVDEQQPQVGDEVLVLRGPTREYETKDGEQREVFPYVLRRRECAEPLPGAGLPPGTGGDEPDEDDIPFLCQGGSDTRSASSALDVTVPT